MKPIIILLSTLLLTGCTTVKETVLVNNKGEIIKCGGETLNPNPAVIIAHSLWDQGCINSANKKGYVEK